MAADEQQPQNVVAIVLPVDPLGEIVSASPRSEIASSSGSASCFLLRRRSSIATLRPTMMKPGAGSRGGPFCGQLLRARRQASWNASSAVSRSRK